MEQEKTSSSAYFITLTYDTKHVPISRNGFMELRKRDVQLFFKRVRKIHSKWAGSSVGCIRYYVAGEYGGQKRRPHYHMLLFNVQLELMVDKHYCDKMFWDGKTQMDCVQWPHGKITIGSVTGASVGYTLKYMTKKRSVPMHRNDDRQPEFSLMSKGLGMSYLTDAMIAWHKHDLLNRMYCIVDGTKKIAMPRYFKDKVYSLMERSEVSGYQKGEMEKRAREEYERHKEDPMYWHRKHASINAQFRKMYKDAEEGRDKI